jgi:hypothetical protein
VDVLDPRDLPFYFLFRFRFSNQKQGRETKQSFLTTAMRQWAISPWLEWWWWSANSNTMRRNKNRES